MNAMERKAEVPGPVLRVWEVHKKKKKKTWTRSKMDRGREKERDAVSESMRGIEANARANTKRAGEITNNEAKS